MKPSHKELAKLYWEEGKEHTLSQIADLYRVDHSTVHAWMVAYDIPRRDHASGKRQLRVIDPAQLERDYRSGKTMKELAKELGCRWETIKKHLRKRGIKNFRPRHSRRREHCKEPGCIKPVFRIRHAGNGSLYGTRCRYHRTLHYAELNRKRTRRVRHIPPERWRYA